MVQFSGNDGAIVWPLWKDNLMNRVKVELGNVAIRILEGKLGPQTAVRLRPLRGHRRRWSWRAPPWGAEPRGGPDARPRQQRLP